MIIFLIDNYKQVHIFPRDTTLGFMLTRLMKKQQHPYLHGMHNFVKFIYNITLSIMLTSFFTYRYKSEKLAKIRRDWFRSSTFSLKSSIDISNTPRIRLSQFPTVRNVSFLTLKFQCCQHIKYDIMYLIF